MEPSASNTVDIFNRHASGTNTSYSRRLSFLSASNVVQAPLYALLEYSGLLRTRSNHQDTDTFINGSPPSSSASAADVSDGEVSIRIIGTAENELDREGTGLVVGHVREPFSQNDISIVSSMVGMHGAAPSASVSETHLHSRTDQVAGEAILHSTNGATDTADGEGVGPNGRDSSYQRYDIQQAARWIEQILPFSLLLLVVFIRQHLQGFFVTIWIAAVLFKSNDILRKQTALKGERKISVLTGISIAFTLHVICVYWWYQNDDILFPMVMLPPRAIPPFWHAVFIILVIDTMVRQAAMVIKCILLIYYKNSRGRNYRKQGQMLTLVEYLLLLYRALLPTPVWYSFFLNKDYGSLFSSLMTGLYLTFKLTSVVEKGFLLLVDLVATKEFGSVEFLMGVKKVQSLFAAVKALSHKEVHYGAYATSEQIHSAGDLCAICQEKMHAPILLCCKHIFCEDCVSEWFERERTCPLCRALVRPADLRSFGDGSTSLFFQLF